MGAAHCCASHTVIFGLLTLLVYSTVFAAASAAAASAGVTRAPDMPNGPSKNGDAVSAVVPQDSDSPSLGHFWGGFESLVTGRGKKQRQASQRLAATAGLVAVVCLSVAFVVLQCARKSLFPRLSGSLNKRALSDSGWQQKDICTGDGEDEGEGGAWGGVPWEEVEPSLGTGESKAVETLQELQHLMVLGAQTVQAFPTDRQALVLVLLLTVASQELLVFAFYSTEVVETERQATINFVCDIMTTFLQQLSEEVLRSDVAQQINPLMTMLELLRTSPPDRTSEDLDVEATLSLFRVAQARRTLSELLFWVGTGDPVPESVSKKALKLVGYARQAGKSRLKGDCWLREWMGMMQEFLGFYEVYEPYDDYDSVFCRLSLKEEMKKLTARFGRLGRSFFSAVSVAKGLDPPPPEVTLGPHHGRPRRKKKKNQQHQAHHPAQHFPTSSAAWSTGPQSVSQQPTGRASAPAQPSWLLGGPDQPSLPTKSPNTRSRRAPVPPRLRRKNREQEDPASHPEGGHQFPPDSAPRVQQPSQGRPHQQSLPSASAPVPVLPPADASPLTPDDSSETEEQVDEQLEERLSEQMARILTVARGVWGQSPFGSNGPSQPSYAYTGAGSSEPPHSTLTVPRHQSTLGLVGAVSGHSGDGIVGLNSQGASTQPHHRGAFPPRHPFSHSTHGAPSGFPQPNFPGFPSHTPQRGFTPPQQPSRGPLPKPPSSRIGTVGFLRTSEGGGTQGLFPPHGTPQAGDQGPRRPHAAGAFPTSGPYGPAGAQQPQEEVDGWPRVLPPHPPPPSSATWGPFTLGGGGMQQPQESQGASPPADVTQQTEEASGWSLWGGKGNGNRRW
ncbi:hypothetical protein EAH_00044510 [Eimeria acervulina]|uniref:Uncharacterized protein n=1 Tax=Eimeria acervulina TaxID=5801 RepID=U6GJ98_EIMAC|nr:hypothetical protein EAH_00044510 [Eimeria acervulina]CDI79632.1 hypothetical protein EAH_00044510 [Eimeria acervulina]